MLELSKEILQKVSFDRQLFSKELRKSLKWLKKEEVFLFKAWCLSQFGDIYGDVIRESFSTFVRS